VRKNSEKSCAVSRHAGAGRERVCTAIGRKKIFDLWRKSENAIAPHKEAVNRMARGAQ
jgi:hypothetical protein